MFSSNIVHLGGTVYSYHSNISFQEDFATVFKNNNAKVDGGAIYSYYSNISFQKNSATVFKNNNADDGGGAMYIFLFRSYMA